MTAANYNEVFRQLHRLGLHQFASRISAGQYLPVYRKCASLHCAQKDVLDWGAGNGHFTCFLLEEGAAVTAFNIDDSFEIKTHLENKFKERFRLEIGPQSTHILPFPDASFDIVTSIGVLEHVRETGSTEEKSLAEIKRILKPGGYFFCAHFPNRYSWIEWLARKSSTRFFHKFLYTRSEIGPLVAESGLELVDQRLYGFLPRLMFRGVPNLSILSQTFRMIDWLGARVLPWLCQNHYFVARKPQ